MDDKDQSFHQYLQDPDIRKDDEQKQPLIGQMPLNNDRHHRHHRDHHHSHHHQHHPHHFQDGRPTYHPRMGDGFIPGHPGPQGDPALGM